MSGEYPSNAEYNKLVRDKIPQIIERDGLVVEFKRLTSEEVASHLRDKLIEESHEVREAADISDTKKEMADVLEVVYSLAERLDISLEEIEKIRQERLEIRGGFDEGIFLERTRKKE